MTIETSYDSKYGSGDRRGLITADEIAKNGSHISVIGEVIDGDLETHYSIRALSTRYIKIQLNKPVFIDEIRFVGHAPNLTISIFEEAIDGTLIGQVRGSMPLKTELPLKKHQIFFVKLDSSSGNNSLLQEVEFKAYTAPQKALIKKDNQYGYYTDSFQSLGTSYPTKEHFEQYGMSDLSTLETGDIPVEYEMELISETDEEKCFSYSFDLNGQHKNMKSIDGIITE